MPVLLITGGFLSDASYPLPTYTHRKTHNHTQPPTPLSTRCQTFVHWVLTKTRPLAEHPGNDGHPDGGGQSRASRRRHPGQPGGGPELPAALEGPQRLRPAERHRPAGLPTTGSFFFVQLCFNIDLFAILAIEIISFSVFKIFLSSNLTMQTSAGV